MNILITGANGQLGNEMRIVAKTSSDKYIFTDVNQVEGFSMLHRPTEAYRYSTIRWE